MVKKINLLVLLTSVFFSCAQKQPKEFVSLQGKIENNKDSALTIISRAGIVKSISIKEDGSFKDTLKVDNGGIYTIQTSSANRAPIYLKNGYDLTVKALVEEWGGREGYVDKWRADARNKDIEASDEEILSYAEKQHPGLFG
jgi:hypothetical protein